AVRVGDSLVPSLATAIAARAAGIPADEVRFHAGELRLGDKAFILDADLHMRPRYFEPAAFVQLPYWQVAAGDAPAYLVRDKIVLIGFTGATLAPASNVRTPQGAAPSVTALASAVSSLISNRLYAHPSLTTWIERSAAVGAIAFCALALPSAGLGLSALASVLLICALLMGEVALLSTAQLWARLVLPCAALAAGYGVYALGEMMRRANAAGPDARHAGIDLRELAQTLQQRGQLDLAFETYQRCPLDEQTMELLYALGLDFERRRQAPKAGAVYAHIARRDPNYRDLRARRARLSQSALTRKPPLAFSPNDREQALERERVIALEDLDPKAPAKSSRTLGRYEIERELGKGAMGVVYLGRDPHINRVVAIKAIPLAEEFEEDDLADVRARFFREAEMAGRLNHPSIVTVYDAGEDQGLAYIAMEYVQGQHLSHFTDSSGLLPLKSVLLLVARAADALHYAHRQNVVHRDIKPANIMFNPGTDELKITDFGIARLTDTSRTKTGIVLGTPSFMSPEQLEGCMLDGRSDQFALGVS
ncbi:MAG TPA: protein kinase, partial [Steroidobacter sp.]|nr:protein kinase [Steroidobacter sp.]